MLLLVMYDIATEDRGGAGRLRSAAKICLNWGTRVQNSVYECSVSPDQYTLLRRQLEQTIDPVRDSVCFYNLGSRGKRCECIGTAEREAQLFVI